MLVGDAKFINADGYSPFLVIVESVDPSGVCVGRVISDRPDLEPLFIDGHPGFVAFSTEDVLTFNNMSTLEKSFEKSFMEYKKK